MRQHFVNELDNFIGGWYISEELCDKILEIVKLKSSFLKNIQQENSETNRNYFYTSFWEMSEFNLQKDYFSSLDEVLFQYKKKYETSDDVYAYAVGNDYKLQYYKSNSCYSDLHCENSGSYNVFGWRHLVFMTYLNDIDNGGETEFIHQNIKVRPEKGLTLIWPSQWTHTHRGLPTQSEKYIITGWYYFINEMTNKFISWPQEFCTAETTSQASI